MNIVELHLRACDIYGSTINLFNWQLEYMKTHGQDKYTNIQLGVLTKSFITRAKLL